MTQLARCLSAASLRRLARTWALALAFWPRAAVSRISKLYCIDTWENDAMSEGKKSTFDAFTQNTSRNSLTSSFPCEGERWIW